MKGKRVSVFLIVEFADSVGNVERVMMTIAEMTAGKVFTAVDVEISPRAVSSRPSS